MCVGSGWKSLALVARICSELPSKWIRVTEAGGIWMRTILLNLSEDVLDTSRRCADILQLSRAEYMRRAVEHMNRQTHALLRARRLAEASKKVRKESLRVNREFATIERTPDV